jgi:nitroreductase
MLMLEMLLKRRSIRKYENRPVELDKIEKIMKAALLAPSGKNIKPWEFIVVTEPEMMEKLSNARESGAAFLKDAPLCIVILADPSKSDIWIEDASISAVLIQLQVESLGLGSCWVQVRNRTCGPVRTSEDYIRELLDIPEHYHVASMISIGYPAEEKPAYQDNDLKNEKVYVNRYGIGL